LPRYGTHGTDVFCGGRRALRLRRQRPHYARNLSRESGPRLRWHGSPLPIRRPHDQLRTRRVSWNQSQICFAFCQLARDAGRARAPCPSKPARSPPGATETAAVLQPVRTIRVYGVNMADHHEALGGGSLRVEELRSGLYRVVPCGEGSVEISQPIGLPSTHLFTSGTGSRPVTPRVDRRCGPEHRANTGNFSPPLTRRAWAGLCPRLAVKSRCSPWTTYFRG
jgi:hypothetical protein